MNFDGPCELVAFLTLILRIYQKAGLAYRCLLVLVSFEADKYSVSMSVAQIIWVHKPSRSRRVNPEYEKG